MRIGISPFPSLIERNALPITAPNALSGSSAFIACPSVREVVNKSPISIAPRQVGSFLGLTPSPYSSGEEEAECSQKALRLSGPFGCLLRLQHLDEGECGKI